LMFVGVTRASSGRTFSRKGAFALRALLLRTSLSESSRLHCGGVRSILASFSPPARTIFSNTCSALSRGKNVVRSSLHNMAGHRVCPWSLSTDLSAESSCYGLPHYWSWHLRFVSYRCSTLASRGETDRPERLWHG